MNESDKGTVIVISSHVVRGTVGNRAAVFALETLGHPVWALPTVILPWHPGHGPSTRIQIPESEFDAVIDDLIRAPWVGEVKAVLCCSAPPPHERASRVRPDARRRGGCPDGEVSVRGRAHA